MRSQCSISIVFKGERGKAPSINYVTREGEGSLAILKMVPVGHGGGGGGRGF
jgi:hypothetical protein